MAARSSTWRVRRPPLGARAAGMADKERENAAAGDDAADRTAGNKSEERKQGGEAEMTKNAPTQARGWRSWQQGRMMDAPAEAERRGVNAGQRASHRDASAPHPLHRRRLATTPPAGHERKENESFDKKLYALIKVNYLFSAHISAETFKGRILSKVIRDFSIMSPRLMHVPPLSGRHPNVTKVGGRCRELKPCSVNTLR